MEPCDAQIELADLASLFDRDRGRVNTLTVKCNVAVACDITVIGNLQAVEVGRGALSPDEITGRPRSSRV